MNASMTANKRAATFGSRVVDMELVIGIDRNLRRTDFGDLLSEVATRCGNVDPYLGDDGLVDLM